MRTFRPVFFSIIFLFIVTLSNCGNPPEEKTELTILTKKEITVKPEAAQYLTDIYPNAITSPTKNIIAIPNLSSPTSVILFDYEGNLIARVGEEGRGPGEFLDNQQMGFGEKNSLVVNDRKQKMIKKFSLKNDTVYTFNPTIPDDIYISSNRLWHCGDKWYVGIGNISKGSTQKSPTVGIFDSNFSLTKSVGGFDPYFNGNSSVLKRPRVTADCEKKLFYTTHAKVPFIQVYNLTNFTRIARTTTIPPSFRLSEEFIGMVKSSSRMQEFMTEEQSVNSFIALTEKFIIVPFNNNTEKFYATRNYVDDKHFLAVYSRDDYAFLGEVPIEGVPLAATKEGYLVILKNDNPDNFQLELVEVKETDS